MSALPPGSVIGILGGGQLARMLAMAAARLGFLTHVYSDTDDACAFDVATFRTVDSYTDEQALAAFAARVDAVTYEFENVPAGTAEALARAKPVRPSAAALAIAQDRLREKTFAAELGIPVAPYRPVDGEDEAREAFSALGGGTSILKTRRMGYDGKGQAKVRSPDEAAAAWRRFSVPCILEGLVRFDAECSVIVARSLDGTVAAYDTVENIHRDHILAESHVPARIRPEAAYEARRVAGSLAGALAYVGVMGVELFVTPEAVLFNEIAPRVHNSGHWTLEACTCSQFEQHIRAVAGWPLGSPERHADAVMHNLIGSDAAGWATLAAEPGAALHLYGKGDARPGRKMGHVTRLAPLSRQPAG